MMASDVVGLPQCDSVAPSLARLLLLNTGAGAERLRAGRRRDVPAAPGRQTRGLYAR